MHAGEAVAGERLVAGFSQPGQLLGRSAGIGSNHDVALVHTDAAVTGGGSAPALGRIGRRFDGFGSFDDLWR